MTHFIGVDPGISGAFACIDEAGHIKWVHDMPTRADHPATGGYDVAGIKERVGESGKYGVEWPQTRPGEGAQRSRNFGLGLGYIEMALVCHHRDWERIDPQKWKNRLGLGAKQNDFGLREHLAAFDLAFPDSRSWITGPRGGIKDGRMEALLIAEYLRAGTVGGLRATVERFGADSVEAMAKVLGGGRKKRKRGLDYL